jgi:protein TonB
LILNVNIMTPSQGRHTERAGAAFTARTLLWSFAASAAMHGALLYVIANEEVVLTRVQPGLMLVRLTSGSSGRANAGGRGTNDLAVAPHNSAGQTEDSTRRETRPELPAQIARSKAAPQPREAQRSQPAKTIARPYESRPRVEARSPARSGQSVAHPADLPPAAPSVARATDGVIASSGGATSDDGRGQVASAGPATGGPYGTEQGGSDGDGFGDGGVGRGSYYDLLSAWLERYKQYPDLARRRGLEGTASLRVAIRRDGSVISAALQAPSRHDVLDRAALDLVRRAEPFPHMPSDLGGDRFEFVVPIHFHLDRRG